MMQIPVLLAASGGTFSILLPALVLTSSDKGLLHFLYKKQACPNGTFPLVGGHIFCPACLPVLLKGSLLPPHPTSLLTLEGSHLTQIFIPFTLRCDLFT